MQFQIRIDENNSLTINTLLQEPSPGEQLSSPEVTAATITDEKLSHLSTTQFLDVLGQAIDHLAAPAPSAPLQDDWRAKFRAGTL